MGVRIVIVDDEPSVLSLIPRMLREPSWDVCTYGDPLQAIAAMRDDPPDVLLTDIRMPDMNGYQLITALRSMHPRVICGVMSGWGIVQPEDCSVDFEVAKPEGIRDIHRHIEAAVASLQRCA